MADVDSGAARAGRVLALDFGKKRIGLAVSDELGLTAQGLDTLHRTRVRDDIEAARLSREPVQRLAGADRDAAAHERRREPAIGTHA